MMTTLPRHQLRWLIPGLTLTGFLLVRSLSHFWLGSHSLQQVFLLLTGLTVIGLLWALFLFWWQADLALRRGLALTFGLGLAVRLILVAITPMSSHFADTCLTMESGSVISHDIRTYDPTNQPALRAQLRDDDYAYLPPIASIPADWNFHTSTHLPLSLLLYGVFDVWWPTTLAFRLSFSVLDTLLGCFAYWWLWLMLLPLRPGEVPTGWLAYLRRGLAGRTIEFYVLGLVILSPVLLKAGTVILETKGTCSLLMVASLCFFHQRAARLRLLVSPALLGMSIAYMGVGVFLVPYFAGWLLLRQARLGPLVSWPSAKALGEAAQFGAVTALCAGIWFVPFVPDILLMIKARLAFSTTYVLFASPWKPVMALLPVHWTLVKQLFSVLFLGTAVIGFLRGRLSVSLFTASLFLYFLTVSVTDGSMDRVYMGLLLVMLLTVGEHRRAVYSLVMICGVGGLLTLLVGVVIYIMKQYFHRGYGLEFSLVDGYINAVFCLVFLWLLLRNTFGERPPVALSTLTEDQLRGVA
ncbi:hypothetical protein [Fibrella aquatilis]|uniref:Uncharacterized protein n=1 Tax=Fibrella aquatilis TaxID=2817059 RepID=A0A939GCA3_9BACT|nr:hypothetical protein [Fibrella aquatilis]MBO0933753.1 hypothetical protein [Fibrella aquatilis]